MNQIRSALLLAVSISIFNHAGAQSGEDIFKSVCAACHTINQGKLIGPDLSKVYTKQDMPWLISFIRSSQQMVKSNDPAAVAIFNEYNRIPMPDNNLSDQQITSIIDYIKTVDEGSASAAGNRPDSSVATPGNAAIQKDTSGTAVTDTIPVNDNLVKKGSAYFNGNVAFQNKAVSCVSCHNINDGSLFGGGRLARDLTGAYTKLGTAGITAILKNPPFPAMKYAMKGNLNDEEILALNSLLKSASLRNPVTDNLSGMSFFVLGFLGALFLATFLFLLYDERKIHRGIIKE